METNPFEQLDYERWVSEAVSQRWLSLVSDPLATLEKEVVDPLAAYAVFWLCFAGHDDLLPRDAAAAVEAQLTEDARVALETFVDAHAAHKREETDHALAGYVQFLGMPGRLDLPVRYLITVRRRLDAMRGEARARYDKALKLYAKDRAKGVAALDLVARRWGALPEGVAAKKMVHSDALVEAIAKARAGKDKKAAAAVLEKAIKKYAAAVFRYEAKSLLVELGGPDLFEPGERVGEEDD